MTAAATLLLLPNQLFDIKYVRALPHNIKKVVLWEHPHYFKTYKYNRLKLVLHRATMRIHKEYLRECGLVVEYVEFGKALRQPAGAIMFRSADELTRPQWLASIPQHENPNFLMSDAHRSEYRKKTKKFFFNAFYMFGKERTGIMPGVQSTDKQNRETIPKNKNVPTTGIRTTAPQKKYVIEAIAYIKKYFKKNPGPDWDDMLNWRYPLTHSQAKTAFKNFVKNKLSQGFAKYQDYMMFGGPDALFHSFISSSLNIGLINPAELVAMLDAPKNPKETYVRQLFWREYQLYCYRNCTALRSSRLQNSGWFGGRKRLSSAWHSGSLGVYPVDYCIKKAFATGYLHHIERLMVVGNFMLLWGARPTDGFRWFMEFSVDAYEWVMYQNVYDMVFFITGGATMRRPYISSSNYIIKMSNLTKKDSRDWSDTWDTLYHDFIKKNKGRIGYPYE